MGKGIIKNAAHGNVHASAFFCEILLISKLKSFRSCLPTSHSILIHRDSMYLSTKDC